MAIPVVSNSSPIIHLAKIGHLDLLYEQFGEIVIPQAVYEECVVDGKGRPEVKAIERVTWLRVEQVVAKDLITLLSAEIDRGEAEAIALALQSRASRILLDDADAREKARLYRLKMTGVVGILLKAKRTGRIISLAATLDDLSNSGFWLGRTLKQRLLREAGEEA
jgi:predicted nucleic acid-binding protein